MTTYNKKNLLLPDLLHSKFLTFLYFTLFCNIIAGCDGRKSNSTNNYFNDFSLYTLEGIDELKMNDISPDLVYLNLLRSNDQLRKIQVLRDEDLPLADINIHSSKYRKVFDFDVMSSTYGLLKSYLQLNENSAISYFFITPVKTPNETTEIYITRYYVDSTYEYSANIKLVDTINIVKKLLFDEKIIIIDSTQPEKRDLKFDHNFTIKRYLGLN